VWPKREIQQKNPGLTFQKALMCCTESSPRKTVLNVLAHMGVFGDVKVKSGEEELAEE